MTPEVEKKRRELFEARYPDINLERNKYRTEFYIALPTRALWEVWNAALDAVEIETPAISPNHSIEAQLVMRELCKDAITATGLGLRIK